MTDGAGPGIHPTPGIKVTFTALTAASGATGTFPGSLTAVTVTTDANGLATAPVFTANTLAGTYTVTAAVQNNPSVTPAVFSLTNASANAATITATAGTPQSTGTLTTFATGMKALVRDASNNPIAGATVTFTAPAAGASGTFPSTGNNVATATTGSDGIATAPAFAANNIAGSYTVVASVPGATSASFALTNTGVPPATITANAGTPQSAVISTPFATGLQALVTDLGGNPVAGAMVTFQAPGSGASGTFLGWGISATVTTNSSGLATAPTFKANNTTGNYTVTASVAGVGTPAQFSLTNTPGRPANPSPVAGTPQSTVVLTQFATALQALVADAGMNPIPNVAVTFQAPASGASGTFAGGGLTAVVITDANGIAKAPAFTANGAAGTYNVTASAGGAVPPAIFVLTNIAKGTLNIVVNTSGKDGTFNFAASPSLGGVANFAITTTGGSASRNFQNLSGPYTVTLGALPFGFKLTSVMCTSGTVSGLSVSVSPAPGTMTTCTFAIFFDAVGIRTATQAAIQGFMTNRADTITGSQPNQTRGEGRFTGSLFGGSPDDGDGSSGPPAAQFGSAQPLVSNPSFAVGGSAGGSGDPGARFASAQPFLNDPSVGGPAGRRNADMQSLSADAPDTRPNMANPFAISGGGDSSRGNIVGSFSLSSLRKAIAQQEAAKAEQAGLSLNGGPIAAGISPGPPKFDLWAEFQTNYYRSDYGQQRSGFSHLAYTGLDYLVHPAVLFGIMTQVDWTSETGSGAAAGIGASGFGWMAGPYMAIKLTPTLSFDTRAAWGQSQNQVNPFGISDEAFSTDRFLGSARLTGNWKSGDWRFRPEVSTVYFTETQKNYTDPFGIFIPSQTVTLGRVTFGPEVGYLMKLAGGASLEPQAGVKAVYDFSKTSVLAPDGTLTAPETWRAKVEGGLKFKTSGGLVLQGNVSYDGLGAKRFEDVQGQAWLRLPLN